MNKSLFALIGLAIGGVAGFFGGKKFYEQKYAYLAEKEIESVRVVFERKRQELEKMFEPFINDDGSDDDDSDEEKSEDDEDPFEGATDFRNAPNPLDRGDVSVNTYDAAKARHEQYHLVYGRRNGKTVEQKERLNALYGRAAISESDEDDDKDKEPTDASDMTEQDHAKEREEAEKTGPYIIPFEEFTNEHDDHEKVHIFFYTLDAVFCDEQEEPIPEIRRLIGPEAMAAIEVQPTVWVRYPKMGTDYELLRVPRSYSEAVLGIVPTRKRRDRDINNRKDDNDDLQK